MYNHSSYCFNSETYRKVTSTLQRPFTLILLRAHYWCGTLSLWNILCYVSLINNIFLHVLNVTIKIRKLTMIHYYYIICRHQSRLLIVPTILFFWSKRYSSESWVIFSCHVFFVSFSLEKFLIFSLTSSSRHFWRLQVSDFIGSPSF